MINVPLDRTVEALDALRALPLCSRKVGLYGISRGAEHALLLASLMARDHVGTLPDAIAVHAAPDVVCGAFVGAAWRDSGDPGWQAWDVAERVWTWREISGKLAAHHTYRNRTISRRAVSEWPIFKTIG